MPPTYSSSLPLLSSGHRTGWMLTLSATLLFGALAPNTQAQRPPAAPPFAIVGAKPVLPSVQAQISALEAEKDTRTPAQRKVDSQLLYAYKMARRQAIAPGVATLEVSVAPDKQGMVLVDIDARNSLVLLKQLKRGGEIINNFPQLNTIRARVPLTLIPTLAASPDVTFIRPAVQYQLVGHKISNSPAWQSQRAPFPASYLPAAFGPSAFLSSLSREARLRQTLSGLVARASHAAPLAANPNPASGFRALPADPLNMGILPGLTMFGANFRFKTGPIDSEGDATHRADVARSTFKIDGTGIKIGVLSDGVASLATSQGSGELGPVTVLAGQAGSGDEGTAMLEIVHDLAPGATLYFASAFNGVSSFATNIRNLRAAGCDIIVDDVFYLNEAAFQDGPIAQAVNDVTAAGALYFSSAGNQGNKDAGTSAVWEGDFADGGAATIETSSGTGALLHTFGTSALDTANVAFGQTLSVALAWADPLGGSTNDYDLYILNAAGSSVVRASTTTQSGTQDPYELTSATVGQQIVIVKRAAAAPRYLRMNMFANDGASVLSISTPGETFGHSSAVSAFSVAATPAPSQYGGPYPNRFNTSNILENFSSDGPRHVFFSATGTAITPGNFSSTGGALRSKPDITAADGVSTSVNGFDPFFGTSAAAPHAAAIAGLIKSYNPSLTPAQIRTALTSTATDIMAVGYDRNSGFGIVDATSAVTSVPAGAVTSITLNLTSVSGGTSVQGTVTLHDPAPTGGAAVALSVSPTGIASVPATVNVPAGQTTAAFPITTAVVSTDSTVTITAQYNGASRFATLNVVAQYLISGTITTQDNGAVSGVTVAAIGTGTGTIAQTVNPGLSIPDAGAPVSAPLTISSPGTVSSVKVGVNITHTYRGDLRITLAHPDGTTVLLKDNNVSDSADNVITSYPDLTAPVGSLSTLVGKPVAGTWQLIVQDIYAQDVGTLNTFTLTLLADGVPVTLSASTGSNGVYSFANQRPGAFTLTPSKAGFDFIPHTRAVTIGPDQAAQNFTLSQTGIRATATAAFVSGAYQITVTCANNASTGALNTQVTRAILGASAAPTSPALPATLGTLPASSAGSVVLTYPLSAGARGSKVLLRLSGASSLGSFGGSLQVTLP